MYFRNTICKNNSADCDIAGHRKAEEMDTLLTSLRRERQKHEMEESGPDTEEILSQHEAFLVVSIKAGTVPNLTEYELYLQCRRVTERRKNIP